MKYVVAVGGTGQHVVLALADYLVLSHSLVAHALEVPKIVLLDADPAAEERMASAWTLADRQLRFLNQYPDRQGGAAQTERRAVLPENEPGVKTAEEWLTARFRDPMTATRLLTGEQAAIKVVDGYFGEPRVAALLTDVLLEDITGQQGEDEDPLRRLSTEISRDGRRICVVGSAVGGTGAGIIPRLVDHLARPNAKGKLCAVIGLPWFRVRDAYGLQTRMQGNYVACLWRYQQTLLRSAYRLVLWGHPRPETATEETNHGGQRQAAKTNLSLPYIAAAAVQSFLVAPQGDPDLADEIVAPVGETSEGVTLSRALSFGNAALGPLVERNQQLIGRLNLLENYLREPFDGAVLTMLFGTGRVPELDRLDTGRRDALLAALQATRAAKQEALLRLAASDPTFAIGRPPQLAGIAPLRAWARGATLASVAGDLVDTGRMQVGSSSAVMLPPEALRDGANFAPATVGRLTRVEQQHVDNLTRFSEVAGTRVPDVAGIARVLGECLGRHLYWDVDGMPLPELLLENQQATLPPALGADAADTYVAWAQRWFLLLCGLLCGRVTATPLAIPLQVGGLRIEHDLRYKDEVIGSLQRETVVLPSLGAFWSSEERTADLRRAIGAPLTYLRSWAAAVRQVGLCRPPGTIPRWLELLGRVCGGDGEVERSSPECSRDRTVQVRWEPGVDVELPAPAWNLLNEPRASLIDQVMSAFGIVVEEIPSGQMPPGLTGEAAASWQALMREVKTVGLLPAGKLDAWTTTSPAQILWVDLLSPTASRWLYGGTFLPPGAGKAYRASPRFQQLAVDDVLSDTVAVFGDAGGAQVVALPVKGQFAPLLDVQRSSAAIAEGGVQARLSLLGRPQTATRTLGPERVRRIPNTALLVWPRVMSSPRADHHLLRRGAGAFDLRVIYSAAAATPTTSGTHTDSDAVPAAAAVAGASPWYRQAEFFFTIEPGRGADPAIGAPRLLELVEQKDERQLSCGLIGLPLVSAPPTTRPEYWAVDFGTSSTAVFRRVVEQGQASDGQPVYPAAESDATVPISKHRLTRQELLWFPSWNDEGPSSMKSKLMPSQVVRGQGPPRGAPRWGEDFVLDHGDELDENYYGKLVSNLKWAQGGSDGALYRVPYLVSVLQQAITLENAAGRRVPAEIDVTFTLPLRQKDDLQRFVDDLTGGEGVVRRVQQSTGIRIKPAYEWESLAVAPRQALPGMMIVVADLGGGTLDLYARWRPRAGAAGVGGETGSADGITRTAIESGYLGGHRLVNMLHARRALDKENRHVLLRTLRGLAKDKRGQVEFSHGEAVIRPYFELLYRYISIWVGVLRKRWGIADDVPTQLLLVGMGWSLPGSPGATEAVAEKLQQVAMGPLGLGFGFRPWGGLNSRDDEERKLHLARTCSATIGRTAAQLAQVAAECDQVLGLPLQQGERQLAAEELVSRVVGSGLDLIQEEAAKLWSGFGRVEALSVANDRLNRRTDPGDPLSGALTPLGDGLAISALTCAAEVALSLISGPAGDGGG